MGWAILNSKEFLFQHLSGNARIATVTGSRSNGRRKRLPFFFFR